MGYEDDRNPLQMQALPGEEKGSPAQGEDEGSGVVAQLGERLVRNEEVVGSNPISSTRFRLVRQDDTGNVFEIVRGLDKPQADRLQAEFEARGHKQMYWVEEC